MKHLCRFGNCENYFEAGEGITLSGAGWRVRFCCWAHAMRWCLEKSKSYDSAVMPDLNINGTGFENLYQRHENVLAKICELRDLMAEVTVPHGRDYPQKGQHAAAMDQFKQQYEMLESIRLHYYSILEGIVTQHDEQQKVKEGK